MDKVTVVSCWDGTDYYAWDYINRLHRSCRRNVTRPLDFVLYTGPRYDISPGRFALDPEINVVQTGLPFWWCGMPFWQAEPPGIKTRDRLFLDLDVVIIGNLDELFGYPSDHCCSRDWPPEKAPAGHENNVNCGVTLIRGDAGAWVWEEYVRGGMPTWNPFDHKSDNSPFPLAAQGIINDRGGVNLFPENWCVSYKLKVRGNGLPEGCKTVHFHGQPKQGTAGEQFIEDHWR